MPSPKTRTFDVRLSSNTAVLSMLVLAESHEQARALAVDQSALSGYRDAVVEWCIEYPPSIKPRSSRAITDD